MEIPVGAEVQTIGHQQHRGFLNLLFPHSLDGLGRAFGADPLDQADGLLELSVSWVADHGTIPANVVPNTIGQRPTLRVVSLAKGVCPAHPGTADPIADMASCDIPNPLIVNLTVAPLTPPSITELVCQNSSAISVNRFRTILQSVNYPAASFLSATPSQDHPLGSPR
jgi:hypothetical protein